MDGRLLYKHSSQTNTCKKCMETYEIVVQNTTHID